MTAPRQPGTRIFFLLKVVFSGGSTYQGTRPGDPDATMILRNRCAQWRTALGGMFEFLESYFEGDVDIVGGQGLRRLVNPGYRKPPGRFEHPLPPVKRRFLEDLSYPAGTLLINIG